VKNGRFRPLSVHYLRAGLDGAGQIVPGSIASPATRSPRSRTRLRYKGGGERDFLAMAGSELSTYDIPNRLSEQLPRDRDPHLVAARHRLRAEQVRDRGLPRRDRGEARPRSCGPQAQLLKNRARPGGGARGGGNVRVPPRAARPRPRFLLHRLRGNDGGGGGGASVDRKSGKITVHDFGSRSIPDRGAAGQRPRARPRARSSTAWASASPSASASRTAWCRSGTSATRRAAPRGHPECT